MLIDDVVTIYIAIYIVIILLFIVLKEFANRSTIKKF